MRVLDLTLACLFWGLVFANTEKCIFSAPVASVQSKLYIAELAGTLSPSNLRVRTRLPVAFPTDESPRGVESWVVLKNLKPRARYEVRICWLATAPSDWWLHTFEATEVLTGSVSHNLTVTETSERHESSLLLLRISGIASYFTLEKELMEKPQPVLVDLILDEYLLGVLPRSLVGTVAFLVPALGVAMFLGNVVLKSLREFATESMKLKSS